MSEYPKKITMYSGRVVEARNANEELILRQVNRLNDIIQERRKTRLYGESRLDWWRRVRREQK